MNVRAKIEELKEQMLVESEKDEPNQYLIQRLSNQIIQLGFQLTIADFAR